MNWTSTQESQGSIYFTSTQTPESLLEQYQEVRSFSEKLCILLTGSIQGSSRSRATEEQYERKEKPWRDHVTIRLCFLVVIESR